MMFEDLEIDIKTEIEDYVLENLDSEELVIPNKKLCRSLEGTTSGLWDNKVQVLGLIVESNKNEKGQASKSNQNKGDFAENSNKELLGPTGSQCSEINKVNARKVGSVSVTQSKTTLEQNLLDYLKSDGDGKLILKHFNDHKSFNTETRSLLTRTIIKKIKDDALRSLAVGQMLTKFTIQTSVFIALSKAIENLFPGESACTYYTPYKTENGIAIQTTGTLWAHFNYIVKKLRAQNLLETRKSSKKNEKSIPKPQSDEIKMTLKNLENSLDPLMCLDDWRITHNARQVLLLVDKLPITDYMNKFPCLKAQDAIQLIELDFDTLQPGKSHIFQTRWPIVKKMLNKQFQILDADQKKKKKLSVDDLSYIKLLPTLESEHQDAVILYLLQLLIRTGQSGKRKKDELPEAAKRYKPMDIRETFIYRVEKREDMDEALQRLRTKMFERNETLQPLIVIVGSLIKIQEAYVVVDEQRYKVNSCLDALKLTFKTFLALNCDYPKSSIGLWQFIQYAAYDIQLAGDTLIKSVKELLGLTRQAFLEAAISRPEETSLSIRRPTTPDVGSKLATDGTPEGLEITVKIEGE